MIPEFEQFYDQVHLVPVMTPLSFESLPEKLDFPSRRRFDEIASLRRELIKKSGLRPGAYSSIEPDVRHQVDYVLDGLTKLLTTELSAVNALDLCCRLYKRHEEYLGLMRKFEYDSIPAYLHDHQVQGAIERQENAWLRISPLTEPMRWLIEMAVKFSPTSTGDHIGKKKFDQLIVLAHEIHQWDSIWESISHDVIPHQVTVSGDFTLELGLTSRARAIQRAHFKACMPGKVKGNRQWAGDTMRLDSIDITAETGALIVERMAKLRECKILGGALQAERGYSVRDWLKFTYGIIDSFEPTEYFKVIPLSKIESFLASKWDLPAGRLENLLIDHSLSERTVSTLPIEKLRPMRHARRDSRLLRRPTTVLDNHGKRICLFGVDTLELGARMFMERLATGRLHIPDVRPKGPLKRATGKVQKTLGDEFSARVSQRCTDMQLENEREKRIVGKEAIPQGKGFGPIDVFVVDRRNKRFVLTEVKDTSSEGTVPSAMRKERNRFSGFVSKLNRQVDWFSARVGALHDEYGIPRDEIYSVEGVIVVNQPRLWMFAHREELPILDVEAFFRVLKGGREFCTVPVP